MMRLLHWVLAPHTALPTRFPAEWGDPPVRVDGVGDAQYSVLWSDVGSEFYQGCGMVPGGGDGWVKCQALSTIWDVKQAVTMGGILAGGLTWKRLNEEGVAEMWERDAKQMQTIDLPSSLRRFADGNTQPVCFAFLPNKGVAAFQHRRNWRSLEHAAYFAQYWGLVLENGATGGSELGAGVPLEEDLTFASWMVEVRPPGPKTLIVTRMRVRGEEFEGLLQELWGFAHANALEKVEIWDLPVQLQNVALTNGGISKEREEHLPAFKWYGNDPEGQGSFDVHWILKEK